MEIERPQPPSFHHDMIDDWAAWVLDHGLPRLPDSIGEDDQVPIACWAGPSYGAVLSLYCRCDEDDPHRARTVFDDHATYRRTSRGWVPTGGSGGAGGPMDDPLKPTEVPERFADLAFDWRSGPIVGCQGLVGAAARTLELTDRHGVTRRAIEAPLGWVIACFDAGEDVEVRVLDGGGEVLAEARRSRGER